MLTKAKTKISKISRPQDPEVAALVEQMKRHEIAGTVRYDGGMGMFRLSFPNDLSFLTFLHIADADPIANDWPVEFGGLRYGESQGDYELNFRLLIPRKESGRLIKNMKEYEEIPPTYEDLLASGDYEERDGKLFLKPHLLTS